MLYSRTEYGWMLTEVRVVLRSSKVSCEQKLTILVGYRMKVDVIGVFSFFANSNY